LYFINLGWLTISRYDSSGIISLVEEDSNCHLSSL
jgi:hypothetical protein